LDRLNASAVFPPEEASLSVARRFVATTLRDWGMAAVTDDALLATGELAMNAITYAGTPFEVCCSLENGQVELKVRDHHPTRQVPMPGLGEVRGRGLAISAGLAASWGVTYEPRAKTVWIRLPIGGEPALGPPPDAPRPVTPARAEETDPPDPAAEEALERWLGFVAEASDLLAGTLDQERTMALVAQLVVPRLATWCAVYTVDEIGIVRPAYVWHADETRTDALRELLQQLETPPTAQASTPWNGLGLASDAVRAAAGPLATDVAYVFPLIARGRRTGMIVIGRPQGERFPHDGIELAEELSRRAALALDNARLYSAQTAMSTALQRSLLPPALPDIPGLEVAVVYQPAGEGTEVGGDFYDVFACAPDSAGRPRWRFAIGDVCGTGPEAAAVTGLARHAMRILATENMPVPDVLARLNRLILDEGPRARLLTLLHGEIRTRDDGEIRLRLVSAGHPPPLLLDTGGMVREMTTAQPLLGVFDELTYEVDHVDLSPGQVVLCVTDGVTERRNGRVMLGDDHGLERLLATCADLSAGAVAARVQRAVHDYSGEPSGDDVAIIALRVS
jgi:serine phosphatase RsbU (regulator of sigma subunit)/anti-sigma regulatory factor (Ser/Thr protein kinase)